MSLTFHRGIIAEKTSEELFTVDTAGDVAIPKKFLRIMDKYEHDPVALREAGIAFALDQIVDLVSSGAPGVHLYTMNNPYVAKKITENIGSIRTALNEAV